MILLHTLLTTLLVSTVAAAPKAISGRQVDKKYVFASFQAKNEQTSNEETWLNIYTSDDGVHFDDYALDAYRPQKPWLIRDPSIIHYLGKYYVTFTTGWYGSQIGIIASDDLKTWSPHATIELGWAGMQIGAAWAPEFYWDPNGGSLNIIVSIRGKPDCHTVRGEQICGKDPQFKPHILSANSGEPLKLWSAPKEIPLLTNKDSHIDMFVVRKQEDSDRPYHAFIKNEKSKVIEHWKAGLVEGPYDYVGVAGNWGHMEGPAVSRTQDGKWIMYADNYHGKYLYAESDDLNSWGGMTELPNQSGNIRHGTVLLQS
ncbi:glycosyl hydrolase [Xylariales sp. AK1849]|nr:glycosyl hydrolase [Xylariales sp. AK1849]